MFSVYYRRTYRGNECLFISRVDSWQLANALVAALLDDFGDVVTEAWCEEN